MLLRLKEESPEEIAGFVRAARARFALPPGAGVDSTGPPTPARSGSCPGSCWPPRLAGAGWRVMMQGGEGHTEGRVYTSAGLARPRLSPAPDLAAAARRLEQEIRLVTVDRLSPDSTKCSA